MKRCLDVASNDYEVWFLAAEHPDGDGVAMMCYDGAHTAKGSFAPILFRTREDAEKFKHEDLESVCRVEQPMLGKVFSVSGSISRFIFASEQLPEFRWKTVWLYNSSNEGDNRLVSVPIRALLGERPC